MRIKRTDRDFTVRKKADRRIHYAGQGKQYTEHTAIFSPKEKQDALWQKNLSGAGTGIQAHMQRQFNTGRDTGDFFADDTTKSYQQEYGNGSGNRNRDYTALGNLYVKKPLQGCQKESVPHGEQSSGNDQPEQQYQHQDQQQVQRPSAYHENTIKTKEPVLHRKSDVPSSIKRADDFSLKERKGKKEKSQKMKPPAIFKVHKEKYTGESQQESTTGQFPTGNKAGNTSADGYVQTFSARRDSQISNYKRKKFFGSGKEKYRRKTGYENAGRKADTSKSTGTSQPPEAYRMEVQPLQMQDMGGSALLQKQDNFPADNNRTSHIKNRNAGDSIRQRDERISGRKDKTGGKIKRAKRTKEKIRTGKRITAAAVAKAGRTGQPLSGCSPTLRINFHRKSRRTVY